jgi:hypothetical protein
MQKRLDDFSRMNRSLSIYLCEELVPLPLVGEILEMPDFKLCLYLQRRDSLNDPQLTGDSYICTFNQVIEWDSSSRAGNSALIYNNWQENMPSAQKQPGPISVSVRYIKESEEDSSIIHQKIASSQKDNERDGRFYHHYDIPRQEQKPLQKPFQLFVRESRAGKPTIGIEDMLKRRGSVIDQKKRIELAFRLSFALLVLSSTKSAQQSPGWVDWTVGFDAAEGDELSTFIIRPWPCLEIESNGEESLPRTTFPVLNREPVLIRLGICLIELALGRTLADIRSDDHNLWSEHENGGFDLESLNLLTAKRLLSSRRIRQEVSKGFEGVVIACIDQQYRELKGARIMTFNIVDSFFLERATVAILLPLYQELRKSFK